jgi:sugar/nucleoside kinase (ribokinase family)
MPAVPAQVVDTVGAGDAFAAAMLDRLVEEMPADAAMADVLGSPRPAQQREIGLEPA